MHSRAGMAVLIAGLAGSNLLLLGLGILAFIVFSGDFGPTNAQGGPVLGRAGRQAASQSRPAYAGTSALHGSSATGAAGGTSFWSFWSRLGGWPEKPAIGGIYSCASCRGYPSGAHYTRDSWRWQD